MPEPTIVKDRVSIDKYRVTYDWVTLHNLIRHDAADRAGIPRDLLRLSGEATSTLEIERLTEGSPSYGVSKWCAVVRFEVDRDRAGEGYGFTPSPTAVSLFYSMTAGRRAAKLRSGDELFTADIDIPDWQGVIQCHGLTQEEAEARREVILHALNEVTP